MATIESWLIDYLDHGDPDRTSLVSATTCIEP
jgi:hypothetical protein